MKIHPVSERLVRPLVLLDENRAQLAYGTKFCLELHEATPLELAGSYFICSITNNGYTITVHEPCPVLVSHILATFRDMDKCMKYGLELAVEILDCTSTESVEKEVQLYSEQDAKEKAFVRFDCGS